MIPGRRSLLTALGAALPFGLAAGARAAAPAGGREAGPAPTLRFRPFEDAVREAFAGLRPAPDGSPAVRRRIEVGATELLEAGLQGCRNDRPFAGFPAGSLRIVGCGTEPGPSRRGVRLYVAAVDVALTAGPSRGEASRVLDFAAIPPAPTLA